MIGLFKAGFRRRFLGLCLPPLLFSTIDGVMTLLGQSEVYWANHAAVNEASPTFGYLLQIGPAALIAGALVWLLMISALVLALPTTFALIVSIAITFAHTMGSGSWLFGHFDFGYQWTNAYYLFSAVVLGCGIRYALPSERAWHDDVIDIPRNQRMIIGAVVFGAAALAFLFPWRL